MTIVEFLMARIAEDEAMARVWVEVWGPRSEGPDSDYTCHFHPGRALAECETKRRIVERCGSVGALMPSEHLAQGVLTHLAAIYADHPNYDETWA